MDRHGRTARTDPRPSRAAVWAAVGGHGAFTACRLDADAWRARAAAAIAQDRLLRNGGAEHRERGGALGRRIRLTLGGIGARLRLPGLGLSPGLPAARSR